tara:strand:+ start:276 stop:650 length:375 start_codon:yes stop_codon:yes gene_type:complete
MDEFYKKFNKKNLSEDEMVNGLKGMIDEINGLGTSVKRLLKHCRLQFFLGVLLLFTLSSNLWWLSIAGLWVLTFLVASYKYNNMKNLITWYWMSIDQLKSNGKLNGDNEHRIKDFTYFPLPFER